MAAMPFAQEVAIFDLLDFEKHNGGVGCRPGNSWENAREPGLLYALVLWKNRS